MRTPLLIPGLALLALALALPAGAGRSAAAAPKVRLTVCKDVVLATGPKGKYYKCTAVYSLGVPHTVAKLGILVANAGFPKGSRFQLTFLNSKTKQGLTNPVDFGPIRYDPGLWKLTFNGPFPAGLSMTVQPVYKGKPIQTPARISFT